jgi:hypothetical protein
MRDAIVLSASPMETGRASDWVIERATVWGMEETMVVDLARQARRLLQAVIEAFHAGEGRGSSLMLSIEFDQRDAMLEIASEGIFRDFRFVTDEEVLDSAWSAELDRDGMDGVTVFRLSQAATRKVKARAFLH